ncbi:MAG: D-aminoacyl-tRNA deacylase, partial [Aestuariivirga sp.]
MADCSPTSSMARKRESSARRAKSWSAGRSISRAWAARADRQRLRGLVQRVASASVAIDGRIAADIGRGFLVLVCAMAGDREADADTLARKIAALRIFKDDA